MIKHPQFIQVNDKTILAEITRSEGKIIDVHGPYQILGQTGPQQLCQGIIELLHKALHEHPVLKFEDLPEDIRASIAGKDD